MNKWLDEKLRAVKDRDKSKTRMRLAKELGVAPARITEIVKGVRAIRAEEIRGLAQFLEIPEHILWDKVSGGGLRPRELNYILVIGSVEAGAWREAMVWAESEWRRAPVAPVAQYRKINQYGLEVQGPSMDLIYPPGTILICVDVLDYGQDPEPGKKVIVQKKSRQGLVEATVKELRRDSGGDYWLWPRSSHPDFQQPWRMPSADPFGDHEELRITAVVIGSYRPE